MSGLHRAFFAGQRQDIPRTGLDLECRFARDKSLTNLVTGANPWTFTRSTTGTYIDASGSLQTASANVPRFDHDPVTHECLGLLLEDDGENLVANSDSPATQSVTVAAESTVLSFVGSGTVTMSGAYSGSLVGTGPGWANRVHTTFTPTAGSLTLALSGDVSYMQLEQTTKDGFAQPSSYIQSITPPGVRNRDECQIAAGDFSFFDSTSFTIYALASPTMEKFAGNEFPKFLIVESNTAGFLCWGMHRILTGFYDLHVKLADSNDALLFSDDGPAVDKHVAEPPYILAVESGRQVAIIDGSTHLTNSSTSLTTSTDWELILPSSNSWAGHYRDLFIWDNALPDKDLTGLADRWWRDST